MNVLLVAAHPDDEVLGCGGTAARHAALGDAVFVAILGEGITARLDPSGDPAGEQMRGLKESLAKASAILGVRETVHLDFPDNRMDGVDLLDIIRSVEQCVERFSPNVVYTHHAGDLNLDHVMVAKAVLTALRPLPGRIKPEVYAFEVLSSTEWAAGPGFDSFRPTLFVGIEKYLERKVQAMRAYESEVREFPHPRSDEAIRSLASRRGSQCGLRAAEAFMLLRKIVP